MRVGVDAKWLHAGPPSGRRVVANLVRALTELDSGDDLHLLLDRRSRGQPLPAGVELARCHWVWAGNNLAANLWPAPRAADRAALDVVVYQNFVPPRILARHARVAFVHDVIFESHPEYFTRRERAYFAPLRALAASADRVCTVSNTERLRLAEHGYARAVDVDVVPNAPAPEFAPAERPDAGVPAPFVLYAGRLNVRKNVDTIVRAMALVRTAPLHLVLAGAADATTPDLAGIAAACGVAERVHLLGAVSDERLRALYAAAAVFCFPSFDEGFGLGPLEAMACGTPVAASDIPVLRETCGAAAEYCAPGDAASVARAIDAVAGNAERAAALRRAGLARAREFSWRDSAAQLLASAHRAVETRRAHGRAA